MVSLFIDVKELLLTVFNSIDGKLLLITVNNSINAKYFY